MFIMLDKLGAFCYDLNMFKVAVPSDSTKSAGGQTKELILEQALELFRKQGFEKTTMRDIALAAQVATGAAYYYFPSKEAIVSAYYDQVQQAHAAQVREALAGKEGLRERLGIALHAKLEVLRGDRLFLGALFRFTGEPGHPLSVFGKGTQAQRSQSMEIFREALAGAGLSPELEPILPWAIWLVHLGMILFFIHDESEGQTKTHKLVDGVLDMLVGLVRLVNSAPVRPFIKPFQEKLLGMLRDAGLTEES